MKQNIIFAAMVALAALLAGGDVERRYVTAQEIRPRYTWKTSGDVFDLAFSPDGKTLAGGIGRIDQARVVGKAALGSTISIFPGEVTLWEIVTGKELFTIKGDPPRNGLRFSPDGTTFVTCGGVEKKREKGGENARDIQRVGVVKIWESQTGKEKLHLKQDRTVTCTAFSPDGKILATGSFDNTVRLWDVNTGQAVAVLEGHQKLVECVAFSPDGKTLASGGYDEIVRLWDMTTKKQTATLNGPTGPGQGVFALTFSPQGKLLASGVDDGVKLWDVATQKLANARLPGKRSTSLAFSPDGKLLAWPASDRVIRIWDLEADVEIAQLKGHTDSVFAVAFSPNGKTLASGSSDQTIRFWDIDALRKKNP